MRKEPSFARIAQDLGLRLDDIPLASPLLMHKAWRVGQRLLEQAATRQSVEFLPVPESVFDGGLLRDDLGAGDATHGNPAFGRVMLDHFHAYLQRRQP